MLSHSLLEKSDLPRAWAGLDSWKILQTGAPDIHFFLCAWANWRVDPRRPRVLHFVAISPTAPSTLQTPAWHPPQAVIEPPGVFYGELNQLRPLAALLSDQLYGLLPGFHRLTFDGGQVLLTLCIGTLNPMLREQNFSADTLLLLAPSDESPLEGTMATPVNDTSEWDHWTVKSLSRCCRRGTTIAALGLTTVATQALKQAGFDMKSEPSSAVHTGRYNPRWEPRTNRRTFSGGVTKPGTCTVVGAGLAGASVAASLARRGWEVQVLDAAATPATGASGLPVGLMMPHVSADDSPRSRLSRSGLRMTHQEASRHLKAGLDWLATGVLERRLGGASGLAGNCSAAGNAWSRMVDEPDAEAVWLQGLPMGGSSLWHARGAWVKPSRLVQAWLAEPGVTFTGNSQVHSIEQADGQWVLRGRGAQVIGQSSHVVLATAMGTLPLLAQLAISQPDLMKTGSGVHSLRGVSGQVSWGAQLSSDAAVLPPFPVNGSGSLIPSVPIESGLGWFVGATYELTESDSATHIAAQHQVNLARLTTLLPAVANELGHHFDSGTVRAWRNTRCTSPNRLPVVGPVTVETLPTLWVCTALGSRGLSLSVLCAELLAARLCAEPWPIEATLAASLEKSR